MTGTATVNINLSPTNGFVQITNPLRLVDNLSGAQMTIKPGSTQALATDTSPVFQINPNSPGLIPTGTVGSPATATISANIYPTPSSSTGTAALHAIPTALGTSLIVSGTPANLYSYNCTAITGGSAGFCVLYNGTTVPSTGALTAANVIDVCYFDTTSRGCSILRNYPVNYGSGIVMLVTTAATPLTYTTGTDTAWLSADYRN
jgi:hypothetical protein